MDTKCQKRHLARAVPFLASVLAIICLGGCQSSASFRSRSGLQSTGYFDTVVLDAGHGGHDSGARSVSGIPEKSLTLDTTRRTARILRSSGLSVVETRTTDCFIPLDQRVASSNRLKNVIFVSLHFNWSKNSKPSGVETFYYSSRSSSLAAGLQREILKVYGAKNRDIKRRSLYVLRNNNRPAVLCELGFVSNPSENRKLQNAATRQKLAESIAKGILAEKARR
jgi:N-acetylmuramoyl-L-alanine amidase